MRPALRNGKLIRGQRPVGGGADAVDTDYAQFGDLIADYDPRNATASGGRVTLVTEPVNGYNATPDVAGTGPLLTSSDADYGNRPTLVFDTPGPAEGAVRLRTTAGLGVAIGTSAWTWIVVGHSNRVAGNAYPLMHNNANYMGAYYSLSSNRIYAYGPSADLITSMDPSVPGAFGIIHRADGTTRYKFGSSAIGSTASIGAPNASVAFTIGNWQSPNDVFTWGGPMARILVFTGDIGDSNLTAAIDAAIAEYSL